MSYTLTSKLYTGPQGRVKTYTFAGEYGLMVSLELALASWLLHTVGWGAQRACGVPQPAGKGGPDDRSVSLEYVLVDDESGRQFSSGGHTWRGLDDDQAAALRALLRQHIGPYTQLATKA